MQQRTGERPSDLNRISTIQGGVVLETATAVDSGALGNGGEIHRVVAQVAGHDRVADGANNGDVVSALTTVNRGSSEQFHRHKWCRYHHCRARSWSWQFH